MKKVLQFATILLLLFTSQIIYAQWDDGLWVEKQAYNWYFYSGAGLNFMSEPPTPLIGGQLICDPRKVTQFESSGTISDVDGNLLFYTDGKTVWNQNHQVMQNGTGLLGSTSATQSGLVLPKPGDPDIYYIFTAPSTFNPSDGSGLRYSEVNMQLDNGLGVVTQNKNILVSAASDEKMTAVYHADHTKIWLIGHSGNEFKAFLIDENGIDTTPIISAIGSFNYGAGQMKVSPNGEKIALVSILTGDNIEVFDFNDNTGEVSNPMQLNSLSQNGAYGVEFSPNSKYLYFSSPATGVFQVNISLNTETDILNSVVNVGPISDIGSFSGQLQVAPNGKIYLASGGTFRNLVDEIHVINYPNNAGMASGFEANIVDIGALQGNVFSAVSLPSFIQSYFESGILHDEVVCPGEEVTFSTLRIPGIESVSWDYDDPNSGADNTATTSNGTSSHAFSGPGTYTITATVTSNGAQQTATTEITILESATATQPENLMACDDGTSNASFDLDQQDSAILDGQDPSTHTVSYHTTQNDAENNTNAITNPTSYVSSGQTIYARVTTTAGCHAVTQFDLEIAPTPQLSDNLELLACSPIDLTLIAGQVDPNLSLSYYFTENDAENNTNPIANPEEYALSTDEGDVYIKGVNTEGCTEVVKLHLIRKECAIPQGISPNGDQWNQSFDLSYMNIQNIEIFNRYGRSVFNKESYTNEWFGQTDDGDELPTGTYFYVIKLEEGETFKGKQTVTGWVYVNREVN